VDRPFAVVVLLLALVAVAVPILPAAVARLRGRRPERTPTGFGEED